MPRADPDFRHLIPREWKRETHEAGERWRTPADVLVYREYIPIPIAAAKEMIREYRVDAHLAARSNGGGLVECDGAPGGVFAISRLPDHRREQGLIYTGLALTPAGEGHLAWTVMGREGSDAGRRENLVYRQLYGVADFTEHRDEWFAEPYELDGFPGAPVAAGRSTIRCRADDEEFDAKFPEHPLSLVRAIMNQIRTKTRNIARPKSPETLRLAEPEHGFFVELPAGYRPLDYGDLRRGRIFRRWTFDHRLDIIGICPQPDFPDSGRNVRGARRLLKFNAEADAKPVKPKRKPRIEKTTLEGREGILCEVPGHDGERELLTLAMYLPWGDSALEISVGWEGDDRERMGARLRTVLRSLKKIVD